MLSVHDNDEEKKNTYVFVSFARSLSPRSAPSLLDGRHGGLCRAL